jgi:hypothetical protein
VFVLGLGCQKTAKTERITWNARASRSIFQSSSFFAANAAKNELTLRQAKLRKGG